MRTIICACALLGALAETVAYGETFIGPTTSTNRLLIPTNSAIIITATFGDFTNSTQVRINGGFVFTQSFFAPLEHGTVYAVPGPAELIFSSAMLFTYYRLTNSAILFQGIANDPIGIPIPPNSTMHLFGVPAPVNATFERQGSDGGGGLNFTLQPNQPAEFTGPGTLFLNSGVFPPLGKFISYFMAENGIILPGPQGIAGPTGSFAITVDESFDLNTWSPIWMQNTSTPSRAFYRLHVQR
jgi:hypothetical protein